MTSTDLNTTTALNSPFFDAALAAADKDTVLASVTSGQASMSKQFAALEKARGRTSRDLAVQLVEAYQLIQCIRFSVSPEIQAAILTRYQRRAAMGDTSAFTPWIAILFGEADKKGERVKFGGEEHVRWNPDPSYARYFNLYEVLEREQPADLVGFIMDKGGAATIVKDELARKRLDQAPSKATVQAQCDLLLDETTSASLPMDIIVPADAAEFITIVAQRVGNELRPIAVTKKDGTADLRRIAAERFDTLTKARADREEAEKRRRDLDAAKEQARREEEASNAALMGLTVEQWREKKQEMAEGIKAKALAAIADRTNDQAAG